MIGGGACHAVLSTCAWKRAPAFASTAAGAVDASTGARFAATRGRCARHRFAIGAGIRTGAWTGTARPSASIDARSVNAVVGTTRTVAARVGRAESGSMRRSREGA